jgi:hypothetical protein
MKVASRLAQIGAEFLLLTCHSLQKDMETREKTHRGQDYKIDSGPRNKFRRKGPMQISFR